MTTTTTHLDELQELTCQAVRHVFQTMLSIAVAPHAPTPLPPDPDGEIVGSVGFIGQMTGAVYLYSTVSFARLLTSRMLGIPPAEVDSDDMINDAHGELSNMVVGQVKSKLGNRGIACTLTLPSIVRGPQLTVEKPARVTTRIIGFEHGGHHLLAEIFLKDL